MSVDDICSLSSSKKHSDLFSDGSVDRQDGDTGKGSSPDENLLGLKP